MNEPVLNQQAPNPQTLDLRDIHLPDPVSWWPIAPGWWIILASVILICAVIFISRKIYLGRQLSRDIKAELEHIKRQFHKTQNKSQLAKALSILLRRASISYYPGTDIAGLTGNDWLAYLDETSTSSSASKKFQSETGQVLLTAPYLPDDADLYFDAQTLIRLCESWLRSTHRSRHKKTSPGTPSQVAPSRVTPS